MDVKTLVFPVAVTGQTFTCPGLPIRIPSVTIRLSSGDDDSTFVCIGVSNSAHAECLPLKLAEIRRTKATVTIDKAEELPT